MAFDLFLTVVIILAVLIIWWYGSTPKNLPPGPVGLPILGSMPYVKPATAPLTLAKWANKYGPIFSFYQGHKLVVALNDYDTILEAFQKQGDAFSGKPIFLPITSRPPKLGILSSEGSRWKEHRRFALSTLRDFGFGRPILEPKIFLEAHELLSEIAEMNEQAFDPQQFLSTAVSNVICSMIFGRRFEIGSRLKYYLDEISYRISQSEITNLSPFGPWPWLRYFVLPFSAKLRRFASGGEELLRFMQHEIDEARKTFDPNSTQEEPECFVHAFDKAAKEEQLQYVDNVQLKAVITDLFLAGSDTTTTTLRWALFYMSKYPEIQDKVHQEIVDKFGFDELPTFSDRANLPYTEATLLEIQRWATLLPLSLIHAATETAPLLGYTIPQGTWLAANIWAVHQNPNYFPDPNKFFPGRFLDENGAVKRNTQLRQFSAGKRICLGESLARMELFIFFSALMQNFKFCFSSETYADAEPFVGFLRSPGKFLLCAKKRQDL